jgi:hypothetical protein
MRSILQKQFGVFGSRPWILGCVPGEMYIKKEAESQPFVRRLFLPCCLLLGPWHRYGDFKDGAFQVHEHLAYADREVTDEEFCAMRNAFNANGQRLPDDGGSPLITERAR